MKFLKVELSINWYKKAAAAQFDNDKDASLLNIASFLNWMAKDYWNGEIKTLTITEDAKINWK